VNFVSNLADFKVFKDPIRIPRIENRVPRIRENYHRVSRIRENRVPTGPHRVLNIFLKKKESSKT